MADRPNILLITSDQQHFSTLGFANPKISTPALDRLAREGTNFTRAYTNNPVCSPSRSTMITGQYPSWHGCWTIGTKLREEVPTVGDELQAAGYVTSLIGKAHFQPLASQPGSESIECQPTLRDLDFWRNFRGPWYGFRMVETARMHADEYHAGGHYGVWMEEQGFANWREYFQKYPPEPGMPRREHRWDIPESMHYTHWTGEKTIEFIDQHRREGRPFFTWASFHDPHPPYLVPEPWASMYDPADMEPGELVDGEVDAMPAHFQETQKRDADFSRWRETPHGNHGFHSHVHDREKLKKDMAIYYGMVSFMDHEIGRILDHLDETGLADNTIVVFTTDHGHFLGQHGLIAKGGFHYEDLIRLPFLVRWPGQVPAGRTSESLQALVDLPETFLEAAGVEIPLQMQGVGQLDVWRGEKDKAREDLIVEFRHQPTTVHMRSLVTDRYKLTVYRGQTYGELFDLRDDPGEVNNRWDDPAYARVKAELFERFVQAEIAREPLIMPRIAGA